MISFVWSIYAQSLHGKSIIFLLRVKQKEKNHAKISRNDITKKRFIEFRQCFNDDNNVINALIPFYEAVRSSYTHGQLLILNRHIVCL